MVENIDFRPGWPGFDFRLLGRRLVSINLSDLAAMGAEPRHALVSLSLRAKIRVKDIDRLYAGIAEQAHQFGCTIAGGDLSETRGPMTLTATVIGRLASPSRVLKRTGARPGWQIAVTGTLGGAAAGLRLLETGRNPATPKERAWVRAQLDPQPQVAAGRALVQSGIRVGGDISDGLYREIQRLVEPSGLGATLEIGALPLAPGLQAKQWPLAVKDSEDFQLICAAPTSRLKPAQAALQRIGLRLTAVGQIDRQPGIRLRDGARLVRLVKAGYEHFR
jgi:thiamine-monophosphate kinase